MDLTRVIRHIRHTLGAVVSQEKGKFGCFLFEIRLFHLDLDFAFQLQVLQDLLDFVPQTIRTIDI